MSNHRPLEPRELLTLDQILARHHIVAWDLLLIGDGSGSGWDGPSGWACVMIDRISRERWLQHGGVSCGSINQAEAMAYWLMLSWYHATYGAARLKDPAGGGVIHVHVLTDSDVTVTHGRKVCIERQLPGVNRPLWAGFAEFARIGYHFTWQHIPRCSNDLNTACDLVAARCRHAMKTTQLSGPAGEPIPLEHLVPWLLPPTP